MNWLGDYHVHTTYCDGKAEACELAAQAAALGLATLGFSGHAYTDFDETWCMSRAGTRAYLETLQRLKRLYAGQLEILIGTELDYFSPPSEITYDYTIGSCHYVFADGAFLSVDESAEQLRQNVEQYFSGDFLQFAKHYYAQMTDMQQKTGCTFIGHFDLLSKFNESGQFFAEDKAYLSLAFDAVDALCAQDAVFEINTGAMRRGYRSVPYPSFPILRRICENGARIILCSDCHDLNGLCYRFEDAAALARCAGFRSRCVLTAGGLRELAL